MADVNINKFRASVVRDGSKPSSPGFIVSEGQDPVNPPGTNNYVPYSGATANVELGEYGVEAGFITLDTTPTNTPTDQGTIFWDADDETVDIVLNGYTMKIGEDLFYPVKNQTGSTIAKGVAVRFNGTVGNSGRLLIAPFIADGSVASSRFMGVTAEEILNGEDGKVLYFGRVRGINTNAFNEGDILYASTTVAGGYQTAIPVAPNNIVQVAAVVTKSATVGTIFVRPTLGSNINKDEGVKIVSVADKNLLQYQSGTSLWENKSLAQVLGGTSAQFVKGDGSLDSNTYGTGTVTSVGLPSATSGVTIGSTPVTTSGTITLAIATASGSQNGLLSSTDWTTFNNKQNALTNPVTGTGTSGQVAYFNGTSAITSESGLTWDATNNNLSIGGATANSNLTVSGSDNTNIFTVLSGVNSRLHVGTVTTGTVVYMRSQNNYGLNLGINNTDYLSILNTGISVNGDIVLTNGANRFIRIGSATNYNYDLQTTGDDFQIIEAGGSIATPRLTIKYPNGNVLINTTTDNGARLQVSGTATFSGNVGVKTSGRSESLSIEHTLGNNSALFVYTNAITAGQSYGLTVYAGTNSSDRSFLVANQGGASPYLYVRGDGNVGIGTSSPSAKFHVDGYTSGLPPTSGSAQRGGYRIANSSNIAFDFGTVAAGQAWIQVSDVNNYASNFALLLNPNGGNVGIGTTSPSNFNGLSFASPILDVSGSIQIKGIAANGVAALQFGGETYRKGIIYTSIGTDTPYLAFGIGSSGSSSSASEVMRINSSGFLKASNTGTYASSTGTYHELINNVTGNNIAYLWNTSASPYGPYIRFSGAAPNNGTNYYFYCDDTSAARFIVYSNGGISNYQANNTNLSDERTKKEIAPLESYWDKFKAIEIVKFKYKDQTHDDFNIGVIAQQVEKVAPEFVDVDGWNNKTEGNEVVSQEEPIKSIYTADLHHATIKVLQEAMAKIEEMQKEIDILKN